jgi:hypothetical protein
VRACLARWEVPPSPRVFAFGLGLGWADLSP